MGSKPQPSKLPFVELNESNLSPGSRCWKSTSDIIRGALETHGCLVVEYDKDRVMQKDMFMLSEELFSLPAETKRKHTSDLPGFGYGNYSAMPLFEYFGLEDGTSLEAAKLFTHLMWPNGHQTFSETLHAYCKLMQEVERTVLKMVMSSFGLEKYHDPLIESSFYLTRVMKYNAPGANKDSIGIVPHRDKNFISVIGTNEVKGLQIETPDGEWIELEPSPSKFVVIVGEAFMAWSNGRIYCPLHRVIARGIEIKYSVGIFLFIQGSVEVPEELVDGENPLRFKAFSNLEFLDYCKNGGPTIMTGAIKAYCGI